jgi:quinol monooxygenase YgiN
MIIVAGYVYVDPSERDRYVTAFSGFIERTRRLPGCLDMAISGDAADESRVNIFELWESDEILQAFRARANVPNTGIKFHGGAIQEFVIASTRNPFETDR